MRYTKRVKYFHLNNNNKFLLFLSLTYYPVTLRRWPTLMFGPTGLNYLLKHLEQKHE